MKTSNTKKAATPSTLSEKEPETKDVSDLKDNRDLEDSLTDWNAEQNQSGRHK